MGWLVAIVFAGLLIAAYKYTAVSIDLVVLRQVEDPNRALEISTVLETSNIQFLQQHDEAQTVGHMVAMPYVFKVEKSQLANADQILKENNL